MRCAIRRALSMLELLAAIAIGSLALLPLANLLSQSNAESMMSLYEVKARVYALELNQQLLDLAFNPVHPGLRTLRTETGRTVKELLESLNEELSDPFPRAPRAIPIGGRDLFLLVSPLELVFTRRELRVDPLPDDIGFSRTLGRYYKVTILLEWGNPGETTGLNRTGRHRYETVVFLREDV